MWGVMTGERAHTADRARQAAAVIRLDAPSSSELVRPHWLVAESPDAARRGDLFRVA